ncbi:hypothetical protein SAMN02982929_06109 [Saccharopolyspora kobensis]|uniref:Uncharacterized protein n=1 Tax=Saccharopolyspora kobensis TaxID=146035 RepID=A0A1H6EBC8_9PSEU|nr:hypothetical protein [Saccharopolyspora kobensis]SEG95178.1 hypothetical protein SAMN02982929_06109 [Saccharopolyspora kobensis]SFD59447.1 hypothetical protein SAMN05216506_105177 [Saccharopolyspora kobensis]
MHSGRTLGWSGQLDWPPAPQTPARGRHRRTGSAIDRTPAVPRAAAATDPLVDTAPVGGLHKFDLGMVPASVTPPRSWRKAAWFAIASSAAALGGLVLVTSMLSGTTRIDGLDLPTGPMPRGGEYPPLLPDDERDRYFLTGDPTRPQAVRPTGSVLPEPPSDAVGPPPAPGTATTPRPSGSARPTPTTTRPRTTEMPQLLSFTDTDGMKRRSDDYYAAIGRGDLRAAYALTTGQLAEEGYEAFAARYSGADSIEVVDVYVTPTTTVHTLRVTDPDGSVRSERRELRYARGEQPLINSDERLG